METGLFSQVSGILFALSAGPPPAGLPGAAQQGPSLLQTGVKALFPLVAFIAMALGKALLYDTTHLSGLLRISGLAGAGALLLGGAWLSTVRTSRRSA